MADNGVGAIGFDSGNGIAEVSASELVVEGSNVPSIPRLLNQLPQRLKDVAAELVRGGKPQTTVRQLISWYWRAERRGSSVVSQVRKALDEAGLETVPDFNSTYLDGTILFLPKLPEPTPAARTEREALAAEAIPAQVPIGTVQVDPTYRIGRLEIAHRQITYVAPDASIEQATSLMLKRDFSQVPVMTTGRDIKGLFSWKSYGSRIALGVKPSFVREAMDSHCEVNIEASLFSAVHLMAQNDCVLVRDEDRRISGIITPYDISVTFGQLGEPFLLLGEIEMHVRAMIEPRFSPDELRQARHPVDGARPVANVADLTLGEYVRLLDNPEHWARLRLRIDRAMFVKDLGAICEIRNDVMHFDPEGIDDGGLSALREFVRFLQNIQRLRPRE